MSGFRDNLIASTTLATDRKNTAYTPVDGMNFEHDMIAFDTDTGKWVCIKKDTIDMDNFPERYVTNHDVIVGGIDGHLHAVGIRHTNITPEFDGDINPITEGTVYGKGDKIYKVEPNNLYGAVPYYRLEFTLDNNGLIMYGGEFDYNYYGINSNLTGRVTITDHLVWSAGDTLQSVMERINIDNIYDHACLVNEITTPAMVVDSVEVNPESAPTITIPPCIGLSFNNRYFMTITLSNINDANGNTLTPEQSTGGTIYGDVFKLVDMSVYTTFDENNDISTGDVFEWSATTTQSGLSWRGKYPYLWDYTSGVGGYSTHRYFGVYNPYHSSCIGLNLYPQPAWNSYVTDNNIQSYNAYIYDQLGIKRYITTNMWSCSQICNPTNNLTALSNNGMLSTSSSTLGYYDGAGGSQNNSYLYISSGAGGVYGSGVLRSSEFYDLIIKYDGGDITSDAYRMQQYYIKLFEGSDEIVDDAGGRETYKERKARLERWYGPMMDYYHAYLMTHTIGRLDSPENMGNIMGNILNMGVLLTHNMARVFTVTYDFKYMPAYPMAYNTVIYEMLSPYYEQLKRRGMSTWIYSITEPWDVAMIYRNDNMVAINDTIRTICQSSTYIPYRYIFDSRVVTYNVLRTNTMFLMVYMGVTNENRYMYNSTGIYSGGVSGLVDLNYHPSNAIIEYKNKKIYDSLYHQPPILNIQLTEENNSKGSIGQDTKKLSKDDNKSDNNEKDKESSNDNDEYKEYISEPEGPEPIEIGLEPEPMEPLI